MGTVYVSSGVVSSGIVLTSGDYLMIRSGGTAAGITVNRSGYLYVSNGGTAVGATGNEGGTVYVLSGGTAVGATVNRSGYIYAAGEGMILSTTLDQGSAYLGERANAVDLTLNNNGSCYLYGTASSVRVNSRSYLMIYSSGTADDLTVDSGGRAYLKGTNAIGSTVISRGGILLALSSEGKLGGNLTIAGELRTTDRNTVGNLDARNHTITLDLSGRQVNDLSFIDNLSKLSNFQLTVSTSGTQSSGLYNLAGGAADFTGSITVCASNGTCRTLAVGGSAAIGSQTYTLNVTNSVLTLTVSNTGTQKAAELTEYVPGTWSTDWKQASEYARSHNMLIFAYYGDPTWCSFCSYMNTQLFDSPDFQELSKSVVLLYDTPVPGQTYSGAPAGYLLDADGGRIAYRSGFGSGAHDSWMTWLKVQLNLTSGVFLLSGAQCSSMGTSYSGLAFSGGNSCYVISARLNDLQLGSGGLVYLYDRGTVNSGSVLSSGFVYVSSGGTANHITVKPTGRMYVSSGGTADGTVVESSCYIVISAGGSGINTRITSGASMYVYGELKNVEVSSGSAYLYSGAKLTGTANISSGRIYVYTGATVDFDVTGRTSASGVLFNDLTLIQGTAAAYTITVSADQTAGFYKLAANAGSFNKTVTVVNNVDEVLGTVSVGSNLTVGSTVYSLTVTDGILTLQVGSDGSAPVEDTLLPYILPHAEYMYGCSATAAGMLLGYYDLYGYTFAGEHYDFSGLIDGVISVDSRGSDGGSSYDMKDPSVLANFIASTEYAGRFYNKTPDEELPYTYINSDPSQGLNVSVWNCLADYLGTGQYWRGCGDLSTSYYYTTLDSIRSAGWTYTVTDDVVIPARYHDFKYGLALYVEKQGYQLNASATRSVEIRNFTFEDFMAEIDAGRPVLLSMNAGNAGHMVTAYGYNAGTREVIFDDTYCSSCRMAWDGTYTYSGKEYSLSGVTPVVFDVSNMSSGGSDVEGKAVNVYRGNTLVSSADYMSDKTLAGGGNDRMTVDYGGRVYNTAVSSGGELLVSGSQVPSDGIYLLTGGSASKTVVHLGGTMEVTAGAAAYDTVVESGGRLFLTQTSKYNMTWAENPGLAEELGLYEYLFGYGTLDHAVVNSGGSLDMISGTILRGRQVYGGTVTVQNGLVDADGADIVFAVNDRSAADGVILDHLDALTGSEWTPGAASFSITVSASQSAGIYKLAAGASEFTGGMKICTENECFGTVTVNGSALNYNGKSYSLVRDDSLLSLVVSGSSSPVTSDGKVKTYRQDTLVSAADVMTGKTLVGGGAEDSMQVSSGGIASQTQIWSGGSIRVLSGGIAKDTVMSGYYDYPNGHIFAYADIESGGSASGIAVSWCAKLTVSSGAIVSGASVAAWGGSICVLSGGSVNGAAIGPGGVLFVSRGGYVDNVSVQADNFSLVFHLSGGDTETYIHGRNSNGTEFTVQNGVCSNLTMTPNYFGGYIYISSGGVIRETTVSMGYLKVLSGGIASNTTFIGSAGQILYDGAVHSGRITNSSGGFQAASGSIIDFSVVEQSVGDDVLISDLSKITGNPAYTLTISSDQSTGTYRLAGGAADFDQTVSLIVDSAAAGSLTVNGAAVFCGSRSYSLVRDDSLLSLVVSGSSPVISGDAVRTYIGKTLVSSANVMTGKTLIGGGTENIMHVSSGGTANSTTLDSAGSMYVSSGGLASNTVVLSSTQRGSMNVYSGGLAENTDLGGYLNIYNGGSANRTVLNSGGNMYVRVGGTANSVTVNSSGFLYVHSGGSADETTVNSGGYMNISSFATAQNVALSSGGNMFISSGATVLNLDWTPFTGNLRINPGAVVTLVSDYQGVYLGGMNRLISTAMTMNEEVFSGHSMLVFRNGTANSARIDSGYLFVFSGGRADSAEVDYRGSMFIHSGASAMAIRENGGYVAADDAANVSFAANTINNLTVSNQQMTVHSGTVANSTTMNFWAYVYIYSGGTASATAVNSNCGLYISNGGVVKTTVVGSSAHAVVYTGGTADEITVSNGGRLNISDGGRITGKMDFAEGAVVSAFEGGIINFDVSGITPDAEARVNNLSLVKGMPTYTITVSAAQTDGIYWLAGGASSFSGSVEICSGEDCFGTVTVNGEALTHDGCTYQLAVSDDTLTLTVAGTPVELNLTAVGEFATRRYGDRLTAFTDGTIKLKNFWDGAETELGILNPRRWEILGSFDFDADGLLELAVKDRSTGNAYLADDLAGGISEAKLLNGTCLGLLGEGYSFFGAGCFDGKSGADDVLLKGPAFGDSSVSLNYGLPVWAFNSGVKQYDGWLGALVNTWQNGAPLKGDTSDPADINANNYQYDIVAVGDFNGDGVDDVMLQNTMPDKVGTAAITGAGDVFVFLTGNETAVQTGAVPTVSYAGKVDAANLNGWSIACVGDFDGNGTDDILLLDQVSGNTACWIMANGQMQSVTGINTLTDGQEIVGIWDVNADAVDDVILSDGAGGYCAWTIKNGGYSGIQLLA